MRTTVSLDDELVKTAQEYTGITERTALLREALKTLIAREASRQLAATRRDDARPGVRAPATGRRSVILADANIWIDYFRSGDAQLQALLTNDQVVMHPCLAAELALGSLHHRSRTLVKLDAMQQARVASLRDIRQMIESRGLFSKGIGLTDAHLVASCLITPGTLLWTRDNALRAVTKALGIDAGLP